MFRQLMLAALVGIGFGLATAAGAATVSKTIRIDFTASDFTPGPDQRIYAGYGVEPAAPDSVSGWFDFRIDIDTTTNMATAELLRMQDLVLSGQTHRGARGFAFLDGLDSPTASDPFSLIAGELGSRYGPPDTAHFLFAITYDPTDGTLSDAFFHFDNEAGMFPGEIDPFIAGSLSVSSRVLPTPLPPSLLLLAGVLVLPLALRRRRPA